MHPIDEAILEGLLENRIYAIESDRFFVESFHPAPRWTERKFGEMWTAIQLSHRYFGFGYLRNVRSAWEADLEPHNELNHFDVSARCERYLQYELQKNMTE